MAAELGLPRATFAKLSPHPYLLANLQPADENTPPARSNGRSPQTARIPNVHTSSLTHAHGSAVVRTGDTTVICGVRGETLLSSNIPNYRSSNLESELKDYDLLVPNIELATGSAPQFLPGVPPTTLAQTLSTRVYSLLHTAELINPEDLRIWHTQASESQVAEEGDDGDRMEQDTEDVEDTQTGEKVVVAYWVLYIDIFFVSYDGNPFDVAWAAMIAALRDTKLPKAWWDQDREQVLCSREERYPLTISCLPIATTASVFKGKDTSERSSDGDFWVLIDPDSLEDELCDESITAVVDMTGGQTQILGISKQGGTILSPELIKKFIGVAERRWKEFASAMKVAT
jgi:exosome complex component RRP43